MSTFWAKKLEVKGKKLLEKHNYNGAERAFTRALYLIEEVTLRNNLALTIYLQKEPERALKILEPSLSSKGDLLTNPFSHALASQILVDLGQKEKAREELKRAVELFEETISSMKNKREQKIYLASEYTGIIMKVAGILENHHQVLELYEQYRKLKDSWDHHYFAGIASFNLGYYSKAASLWLLAKEVGEIFVIMGKIAKLVEKKSIPPFQLDYNQAHETIWRELSSFQSEEDIYRYVESGTVKMTLLAPIVEVERDENLAQNCLETLIIFGREWGEELGLHILKSKDFPQNITMHAAFTMVKCGLLPFNSPINIYIDGQKKSIVIKNIEASPELKEEVEHLIKKAIQLHQKGELEEAINLLEENMKRELLHPKVMIQLAAFYREAKNLDKAINYLEKLEGVIEDNQELLLELADLWIEKKDLEKASEYMDRIEASRESKAFQDRFSKVNELLEMNEIDLEAIRKEIMIRERNSIGEKKLPLHSSLARGLKNIPAKWLNGMIIHHQLQKTQLRKDKELIIQKYLNKKENLKTILDHEVNPKNRELLIHLLKKGGFDKYHSIISKFGSIDDDYTKDRSNSSPLGWLWFVGLLMVGTTKTDGEETKYVSIPIDLQEPLKDLLGVKEE